MRKKFLFLTLIMFAFAIASTTIGGAFKNNTNIENIIDIEETDTEKEIEKEKDFEKEKLQIAIQTIEIPQLEISNQYYLFSSNIMLQYSEADINPPELFS